MSEEVPLTPVGREQIHKLESALLIGSILRPDVIEVLKNPEERLTWVDSLAVAAAALAREKAKMSVSQIAEDIGRSEATIRNHLHGKTKAGQVVRETYEKFVREGVNIQLPEIFAGPTKPLDVSAKDEEIDRLKKELEISQKKVDELRSTLNETVDKLSQVVELLRKAV